MHTILFSVLIFIIIFSGSLVGMYLRTFLPDYHLNDESREFVTKLGIELAGVMAVLVLALMVTGAQSSFQEQRGEIIGMSSDIVLLHRILTDYGPETAEARVQLRRSVVDDIDELWHENGSQTGGSAPDVDSTLELYNEVLSLNPTGETEISLRNKALGLIFEIQKTLDLLNMQQTRSVPATALIVLSLLVFWFFCIFFGLGIYAPSNATVVFVLILSALSVAIAFFLIIDLHLGFEGILRLPPEPLKETLDYLAK